MEEVKTNESKITPNQSNMPWVVIAVVLGCIGFSFMDGQEKDFNKRINHRRGAEKAEKKKKKRKLLYIFFFPLSFFRSPPPLGWCIKKKI